MLAVRILLWGVILALVVAYFRLQVLRTGQYTLQAEQNRLRAIPVEPPRGTVYDRAGRVVAENRPGYSISLLPGRVDTVRAALERLAPYLDIGPQEQERLMDRYRRFPRQPLTVRHDASFEEVAVVESRRPEFRRVVVETRPRRHYPSGGVLAHVLGYVGEIGERELTLAQFQSYEPGMIVGKTGLEEQYEELLAGTPGVRYVEVDALGSIVAEFGPEPQVPPVPGEDLHLALDLDLQRFAAEIFPDTLRGGVVAMDPRSGEVLVLYSNPTYDPNEFVGGIRPEIWRGLLNDPAQPLLNRVTAAAYSPGSTWKLKVAAEAMRRGVAGIHDRMDVTCRGALRYGTRRFRCWKPEGHGPLDMSGAIKESCNVYFYQLGMRLGLDALLEGAHRMEFHERTGIDLPYERAGGIPDSREWFDRRYGPRGWTESVVLNFSIGQGEIDQTLLRQALFYGALATGSSPPVPRVTRNAGGEPTRVSWDLGLADGEREALVDAMVRVVNEPGGTAYAWRLQDETLAGKTGTAQNPHGDPHSWFVGFAPAEAPSIVVAALVESSQPEGAPSRAAPIVSEIVRRHLEAREDPGVEVRP